MTESKITFSSLNSTEKNALLDFANGDTTNNDEYREIVFDTFVRYKLVQLIPALTARGCEVAEEGGWVWPE
jgi:hypothetical protein